MPKFPLQYLILILDYFSSKINLEFEIINPLGFNQIVDGLNWRCGFKCDIHLFITLIPYFNHQQQSDIPL